MLNTKQTSPYNDLNASQLAGRQIYDQVKESSPFDMVSNVYSDIAQLVGRIHTLTDKLCGPYPMSASGGETKSQSGIFNELNANSQEIYQRILSANEALSRIERMLP